MEHSFSRRNLAQNIIIGLLLCSTVWLFVRIQLYNLGETPTTYITQLLSLDTTYLQEEIASSSPLSAPVAVAVNSSFGRYGSPHLSSQDDSFIPLSSLLGQALSSLTTTATATTSQAFLEAMDATSIYFDFQTPLPCNILSSLVGVSNALNQTVMQRLVLTVHDDGVVYLYWWDGDDDYAYAPTTVEAALFSATLDDYQADNVFFAYEASIEQVTTLEPLSLFTAITSSCVQLTATTPTWSETSLLTQLGFNPYSQARYTETNGTEVIIQGDEQIFLYANGTVAYQSDSPSLLLSAAQDNATAYDLATGANQLVQSLLASIVGEATVSISGFSQTQTQTILTFDYTFDGIPIVMSQGQNAATLVVEHGLVTQLTLTPRQYYAQDSVSLLLPLTQAAATTPGASLELAYVDYGTQEVSVLWIYQ